jgi:hypothetical protein
LFAFDVRGVDQEFCAVRLEQGDVFWGNVSKSSRCSAQRSSSRTINRLSCGQRLNSIWYQILLTFVDSEVCNRLPPVHGHAPSTFNTTTAEVNHEFAGVATKCGQHGLQAVESECA